MKLSTKHTLACMLLSGTALMAPGAFAETTLQALDGSFEMMGTEVTFDEENFFLQTPQGELIVRREFVNCLGDDCPTEDVPIEVAPDDRVTLVSLDGSFELAGSLLELTSTDFVIQTGQGSVTVRREFVTCEGAPCPAIDADRVNFVIAVADVAGADLVSKVVQDFAASKDLTVTQSMGQGANLETILVGNLQGQEIANINVVAMTSQDALKGVMDGSVAFALNQSEATAAQVSELAGEAVSDVSTVLNATTIGLDAISFVTHAKNRINVVNMDVMHDIMTGDVTNWSELGGADAPINVQMLSGNAGVTQQLKARMLEDDELASTHNIHQTAAALNAAIAADENAIGVVYRSQNAAGKPLDLVSQCSIFFDNSDFSVQTEEYPLTVRWNLHTLADTQMPDFAASINDFMVTDFGQQTVASAGLVAQELRVRAIKDQGARMLTSVLASGNGTRTAQVTREYLAEIANAERLSTSLRFLTGAASLDAKALADIKRISSVVRSDEYEGYELLVIGFTDSVGSVANNLSLSNRRAAAVRDILLSENVGYLDRSTVSTFGMGPIAPVNCNDVATGRELNRRVEIWIRPKAEATG